jgi:Ca2+-binding RTX toxin-like protein
MWLNPNHTHLDYRIVITGLDLGLVALGFPLTPDEGDDLYGLHIHYGPKGTAGPVALGIANPNNDLNTKYSYNKKTKTWTVTGRWSANDPSVVDFNFNLANYLKEGYDYVNAHNDAVPLGVIEGRFDPLNAAAVAFIEAPATPANAYLTKSSNLECLDPLCQESLPGADVLTGKAGSDVFCFHATSDSFDRAGQRDQLVNFDPGEDRLDLRGFDGNSRLPGLQKLTFIGEQAFAKNQPGQLRYSQGVLSADLNGDAKSDFAIDFGGAPALTAANFLI